MTEPRLLSEVQVEARRLAWPAEVARVLDAWAKADHAAELGRYYTRLAAAGAWHEYFNLSDAQWVLSKATDRIRGPWWPWVWEAWRQLAETGAVDATVPDYAVAAFDTWGTAVRVLLAELEAADARLHGGAPEQLPRGVATAAL